MAFRERIFRRPRGDATTVPSGGSDWTADAATTTPRGDGVGPVADATAAPVEAPDAGMTAATAHDPHHQAAPAAVPADGEPDASGSTVVMPAVDAAAQPVVPAGRPGFRQRGRMRRRLRYLREVRELGYRDLGGLIFDQHRFGRPNEALVQGKVNAIDAIDRESRALGAALEDRTAYSELRVAGVSACQRCGGLHGSDARFCPSCGLAFGGPRTVAGVWADHPVAPPEARAAVAPAAIAPTEAPAAPVAQPEPIAPPEPAPADPAP